MGGKIQLCQKFTLVFSQKPLAAMGGRANFLTLICLAHFA